jgi:hypothetical protein
MEALVIEAAQKPRYHAAAVMVSNYTVTLAAIGARLARDAGIPAEAASRIFLPLLEGTVKNLEALGPASALTGPIRRGDVGNGGGPLGRAGRSGPAIVRDAGSAGRRPRARGRPRDDRAAGLRDVLRSEADPL